MEMMIALWRMAVKEGMLERPVLTARDELARDGQREHNHWKSVRCRISNLL